MQDYSLKKLLNFMDNSPIGTNETGKAPTMSQFNLLLGIVIGVVVVCMLGFITLLISYFTASQSTFESLKNQIIIQNGKIDNITEGLQAKHIIQ